MKLVVTAKELKWGRTIYKRGETFQTVTQTDERLAKGLILIGKAAEEPIHRPVRKVATTVAPRAMQAAPEKPARRFPTYGTRRLKAED